MKSLYVIKNVTKNSWLDVTGKWTAVPYYLTSGFKKESLAKKALAKIYVLGDSYEIVKLVFCFNSK